MHSKRSYAIQLVRELAQSVTSDLLPFPFACCPWSRCYTSYSCCLPLFHSFIASFGLIKFYLPSAPGEVIVAEGVPLSWLFQSHWSPSPLHLKPLPFGHPFMLCCFTFGTGHTLCFYLLYKTDVILNVH